MRARFRRLLRRFLRRMKLQVIYQRQVTVERRDKDGGRHYRMLTQQMIPPRFWWVTRARTAEYERLPELYLDAAEAQAMVEKKFGVISRQVAKRSAFRRAKVRGY